MKLAKLLIPLAVLAAVSGCKKAESLYMTLSQKSLTVEAVDTTAEFSISANTYYRVNNDITWATLTKKETVGDKTSFLLTFPKNELYVSRNSTIRFIGDGVTPLKLNFTQKAAIPEGVFPNYVEVIYSQTSVTVQILATVKGKALDWTIGTDPKQPDFVPDKTGDSGDADVTVNFPVNSGTAARTAVLPVTVGDKNYTLTIVQDYEHYIDLSEGGTSNCYMINKCGMYMFNAKVRGNGVVPQSYEDEISAAIDPDPASVEVLWSTYNTDVAPASDDAIIKNAKFENGYFKFMTDLSKLDVSNVIVAAKDENGIILWTWHLWLTEEPTISNIGGDDWMDRNLGATTSDISKGTGSCGFFYQWGRKDPMRCAASFTNGTFIATYPKLSEEESAIMVSAETGTIDYSIKNPRIFIKTNDLKTKKEWIWEWQNHKDRWMDDKKTMFDPCPKGFRVPSVSQITSFYKGGGFTSGEKETWSKAAADIAKKYMPDQYMLDGGDAWKMPLSGDIQYDSGTAVNACGTNCRLSTSTYHSTDMQCLYLNCNTSAINPKSNATAQHGGSVRCVKE